MFNLLIKTNTGSLEETETFEYDGEIYKLYTGEESINNRLFTGREFDKETSFYYYRARYYSPSLGRFISRDPIGIKDDINLYAYVGNNPINYTDPSGEVAKEIAGDVIDAFDMIDWNKMQYDTGKGLSSVGQNSQIALETCNLSVKGFYGCIPAGYSAGLFMGDGDLLVGAAYVPPTCGVSAIATAGVCVGTIGLEASRELGNYMMNSSGGRNDGGKWFPKRELPRDKYGNPIPDTDLPHTQLGTKKGRKGEYGQAREFGENGEIKKDIDFTDHGRPQNHTNPHEHPYTENPTGGTKKRN